MTGTLEKVTSSWEVRSLRFILRVILWLVFAGYVLMSVQGAVAWGKMKWVRAQDISSLGGVVEKALAEGDLPALESWVLLRPLSETDEIMRQLEPHTSELGPVMFGEYTRRLDKLDRPEEVLFWHQYARFRMRYDMLRCGAPDSAEIMTALQTLFPNKTVGRLLEENPARVEQSIRQVLDLDAKHPARNDPSSLCGHMNKLQGGNYVIVPKEKWADIRYTLRMVTEVALEQMQEENRPQKTE